MRLTVPVIAQVAQQSMSFDNVLALRPGAILELNHLAQQDQDLLINNHRIGQGATVTVGEHFGIRITEISSPRQRIKAMGR